MPRFAVLLALALTLTACKRTPTPPPPTTESREIAFVQSFYDWYNTLALGDKLNDAPSRIAIQQRPAFFDAPLLAALQNDAAIQAKARGEIDGLDFDPFGYGQDPSGIKSFKAISASGNIVTVQQIDTVPQPTPTATLGIEVRCDPSHCVIVNVHFPAQPAGEGTPQPIPAYDLLGLLQQLHPDKH